MLLHKVQNSSGEGAIDAVNPGLLTIFFHLSSQPFTHSLLGSVPTSVPYPHIPSLFSLPNLHRTEEGLIFLSSFPDILSICSALAYVPHCLFFPPKTIIWGFLFLLSSLTGRE